MRGTRITFPVTQRTDCAKGSGWEFGEFITYGERREQGELTIERHGHDENHDDQSNGYITVWWNNQRGKPRCWKTSPKKRLRGKIEQRTDSDIRWKPRRETNAFQWHFIDRVARRKLPLQHTKRTRQFLPRVHPAAQKWRTSNIQTWLRRSYNRNNQQRSRDVC